MTRFNPDAKFTQGWKDAILTSIKLRKDPAHKQPSSCAACDYNDKIRKPNTFPGCRSCPIAIIKKGHKEINDGWCETYSNRYQHINEKARLTYLNKMERAVNRRKVIE